LQEVLIIDDAPDELAAITHSLERVFQVRTATQGFQGLKSAAMYPPDLILLNLHLQDQSGISILAELKGNPLLAQTTVIVLAGEHNIDEENLAFSLGAADFVRQPINLMAIKARITTQLELAQARRALSEVHLSRSQELEQARLNTVRLLVKASSFKDADTGFHVLRMSQYSRILALAAGYNTDYSELVFNAAPMHDVGKIGIPDRILNKPGVLSDEEWQIMKDHTIIGREIIGVQGSELLKCSASIAMSHHEKWNGTGYPLGLKGKAIPLEGRICAIADVFDALTELRPYKQPWPVQQAVAYIKDEKGKHFDPELVAHFETSLPEILETQQLYSNL